MTKLEAEALNYWDAMSGLNAALREGDSVEAMYRKQEIAGIAVNTEWPKLQDRCDLCLTGAGDMARLTGRNPHITVLDGIA